MDFGDLRQVWVVGAVCKVLWPPPAMRTVPLHHSVHILSKGFRFYFWTVMELVPSILEEGTIVELNMSLLF